MIFCLFLAAEAAGPNRRSGQTELELSGSSIRLLFKIAHIRAADGARVVVQDDA